MARLKWLSQDILKIKEYFFIGMQIEEDTFNLNKSRFKG